MKRIILLLSIIFFASSSFAAYSVPVSGLSLEECLTIAITNHPLLRKSEGQVRAAKALLEKNKSR